MSLLDFFRLDKLMALIFQIWQLIVSSVELKIETTTLTASFHYTPNKTQIHKMWWCFIFFCWNPHNIRMFASSLFVYIVNVDEITPSLTTSFSFCDYKIYSDHVYLIGRRLRWWSLWGINTTWKRFVILR